MRDTAIIGAARAAGMLARLTRRGGGTALPGLLVERAAPTLITSLSERLTEGAILISGTNGKTTTARLLASLLTNAGYQVTHNREGSNLIRGIASALIKPLGQDNNTGAPKEIGLFEVDEATLPEAIALVQPKLILLLNLFRDQLDRYGEVDTIAAAWRAALRDLPEGTQLVLNADDPQVAALAESTNATTHFFGLEDTGVGLSEREHASDFVECPTCRIPYDYAVSYYGHLGHYRCPRCNGGRPQPTLTAQQVMLEGLKGSSVTLQSDAGQASGYLPLPGLYNVYNLLAAVAAAACLDLSLSALSETLEATRPVFGRGERFSLEGKPAVMLLTKNPVGANQVLRTLASEPGQKSLLIALNDGLADGRDVSWIWDVDYELLRGQVSSVIASGNRAADLGMRLKYAELFEAGARESHAVALPDLAQAITTAAYRLPEGETLYVLPTYTAMLELRRILTKMGAARPFWEEA